MGKVVKRKAEDTGLGLSAALEKLAELLDEQNDEEAAAEILRQAAAELQNNPPNSAAWNTAINLVYDCFEEHELSAYTLPGKSRQDWSTADELYLASTTVWNLVRRLRKSSL